ncbi:MAG: bifunctional (p)ppGpp synthetase/guanosine-3',5'-bis(diphosphate) 3'-pyrophosphohydrolase [Calditrichaceae bacterium]|nr:bifunctional (p)ppGpp synthetase/guanosine-3',5'-bis(diphosphate) 3'-pyrophosphohydrolase [Calditrichaceae bacterium]MBN2709920.1 bifunctional (p)ppGpp synthetase/guanosine-3',5'-bis(diphosphate) 3'-pyrophosphohydrolase [Calditrichaceae bacterium]RQV92672.1 MAG: bifunctional (p)ppGpp synthetase/guanosine-3',5'-bis(diphosphate) 3'-pyrophosphohydrolase [Calditrichota bacterium]
MQILSDTTILRKNTKSIDPLYKLLVKNIKSYYADIDTTLLKKAYDFGMIAHLKQRRYSGEPYFVHCLNVALILSDLKMDPTTIIAGMLHDAVEDTGVTLDEIKKEFGETIANLVDGVTKISSLKFQSNEARQAETFRKMLLSMAQDIRVIIIKFADRLHNMRTLNHLPVKKRPRIALETRDVYAPLAHRLGISRLKTELEDLALKHLDLDVYADLVKKVHESEEEREKYINLIKAPIEEELRNHNIKATIAGRPKSYYSIYQKMKRRNRPFDEIYDLQAIRIIVDKLEECYYALGIVHSKYMPVYDRFKDYIAMPKINGYQSLHTTVVGPEGKMVEIQIRTQEMHQMAEDGIAAHWKYKEGVKGTTKFEEHLGWVKELLERQMQEEDPGDFMEHLKINLYQDEVFVFTPAGDLIKLAVGATPVDFAYAVHTNIGNHCIAAKVNGKLVSLKTELKSGQQVEIITSQNQKPGQDWLSFVKTSKARHWIKKILREEQQTQTLQIGGEILAKFLKKYKLNEDDPLFKDTIPKIGFKNIESLKAAIGRGEFMVETLAKKIFPEKEEPEQTGDSFFVKFLKRARSVSGIRVAGMENMLIHFAKCCQPVPGDRIIGYLSRGKGVTIHRTDCKNMIKLYEEKERIIEVEWDTEEKHKFQVYLSILGEDRKNLLKDITLSVAKLDINIIQVSFKTEEMYAKGNLNIEVSDLQHLTKVINGLRKIPGVFSVERVDNISGISEEM